MRGVIHVAVDGHLVIITLDRPAASNAVDGVMARGLEAAVDRLEGDDDLWVGIVTHTGRVFCAGADLHVLGSGREAELVTPRGGFGGFVRRARTKPVIVATEGPALGGGCELILAADLVVASELASFGFPEVGLGLVAGAGGLIRLPQVIPSRVAMEMLLTGAPIPASRAHQLGLVNRLAPPGQAQAVAVALAAQIMANAPIAVRETRRILTASATDDERWAMTAAVQTTLRTSQDFTEGITARVGKRPPTWTGH